MSKTYEEHFSQTETMTPAEQDLDDYLFACYCIENDKALWRKIDALKEEFYLAGKQYQKQEYKRKIEHILDSANTVRDWNHCKNCIGLCSECDYYGYVLKDVENGIEKYFND